MNSLRFKTIRAALLAALTAAAPVHAQTVTNDDTVLKQIIIFGRHGVRAPVLSPAKYAQYSPRPYPDFGVPAGYLTVHGQQAAVLLGAYYRDYLISQGLLTGNAATDLAHSYFRANSIQRSNITAMKLGEGLIPGVTIPVHSFPLNQLDPVFEPIATNVAAIDTDRAAQEVKEIYNSGTALASAYRGEFSLVRSVLFKYQNGVDVPPVAPLGVTDPTAEPIPLDAVTSTVYSGNVVNIGAILDTQNAADPFVMEYADGMPLSDVGWGQLTLDSLSQQTRIANLELKITFMTPYINQVQSSNAAAHVLRTMRQAVLGETVPGAFGDPASQVMIVTSSDAYVAGLAGLLDLHWQLPGYQPDFCAPAGALVFELRQSRRTGEFLVRTFYTAQSLDQLRNLTPLTLAQPPLTMQLRIPGGSRPGAGFDVKFETFQRLLTNAIGWRYVQDPSQEVQPAVLTGVPLQ
jgi:4-phytase/acid phosphatase